MEPLYEKVEVLSSGEDEEAPDIEESTSSSRAKRGREEDAEAETKTKNKKKKEKNSVVEFKTMNPTEQYKYMGKFLCGAQNVIDEVDYRKAFLATSKTSSPFPTFVDLKNVSRSLKRFGNLLKKLTQDAEKIANKRRSICNDSTGDGETAETVAVGAPRVLVLTGNAKRATQYLKALRSLRGVRVGKLFAKHIKLKEHIEWAKKTEFSIGVGTPHRVERLLAVSALSLQQVRLVLLDTFRNEKEMTMFDMKDTSTSIGVLFSKHIVPYLLQESSATGRTASGRCISLGLF